MAGGTNCRNSDRPMADRQVQLGQPFRDMKGWQKTVPAGRERRVVFAAAATVTGMRIPLMPSGHGAYRAVHPAFG